MKLSLIKVSKLFTWWPVILGLLVVLLLPRLLPSQPAELRRIEYNRSFIPVLSHDGKYLGTTSGINAAILHSSDASMAQCWPLAPSTRGQNSAGIKVVTSSMLGRVEIHNTATSQQSYLALYRDAGPLRLPLTKCDPKTISVSPDERLIAHECPINIKTNQSDGITIISLTDGTPYQLGAQTNELHFAWAKGSTTIFTTNLKRELTQWNPRTREEISREELPYQAIEMQIMEVVDDHRVWLKLIHANLDCSFRLWDKQAKCERACIYIPSDRIVVDRQHFIAHDDRLLLVTRSESFLKKMWWRWASSLKMPEWIAAMEQKIVIEIWNVQQSQLEQSIPCKSPVILCVPPGTNSLLVAESSQYAMYPSMLVWYDIQRVSPWLRAWCWGIGASLLAVALQRLVRWYYVRCPDKVCPIS